VAPAAASGKMRHGASALSNNGGISYRSSAAGERNGVSLAKIASIMAERIGVRKRRRESENEKAAGENGIMAAYAAARGNLAAIIGGEAAAAGMASASLH